MARAQSASNIAQLIIVTRLRKSLLTPHVLNGQLVSVMIDSLVSGAIGRKASSSSSRVGGPIDPNSRNGGMGLDGGTEEGGYHDSASAARNRGIDRAERLAHVSARPARRRASGRTAESFLSDPFNFYYAFYLPNQQMQAMRPRPIDTLNQAVAAPAILLADGPPRIVQPDFTLWRPDLRSSPPLLRPGSGTACKSLPVLAGSLEFRRHRARRSITVAQPPISPVSRSAVEPNANVSAARQQSRSRAGLVLSRGGGGGGGMMGGGGMGGGMGGMGGGGMGGMGGMM